MRRLGCVGWSILLRGYAFRFRGVAVSGSWGFSLAVSSFVASGLSYSTSNSQRLPAIVRGFFGVLVRFVWIHARRRMSACHAAGPEGPHGPGDGPGIPWQQCDSPASRRMVQNEAALGCPYVIDSSNISFLCASCTRWGCI